MTDRVEDFIAPNGRLWSDIRKKKPKKDSLKAKAWSRIQRKPVAVKVMKDGREICSQTSAGVREYQRRTDLMVVRQRGICRCGVLLRTHDIRGYVVGEVPTFGHDVPRGHGGARRDDRIELPDGTPINHAECWDCNAAKGSRRTHEVLKPCPKRERP